jgi:hypothetical protein
MRDAYNISVGNLNKTENHLRDSVVDERIILTWFLKKQGMMV